MLRRDFITGFTSFTLFFKYQNFNSLFDSGRNNTISIEEKEILGLIEPQLCGEHFFLRNEAYEAYLDMSFEAEKDGLKLWCSSAYRNFNNQKNIWNAKHSNLKKTGLSEQEILKTILQYTALPGASRHHWGTDFDIVDALAPKISDPLNEKNFTLKGEYQYLKYWLDLNANRFGFIEVYTNEPTRTGFKYEPWHYSFASLSKPILHQLLAIDFSTVNELSLCKGFELFDREFFENYMQEYILGINKLLI